MRPRHTPSTRRPLRVASAARRDARLPEMTGDLSSSTLQPEPTAPPLWLQSDSTRAETLSCAGSVKHMSHESRRTAPYRSPSTVHGRWTEPDSRASPRTCTDRNRQAHNPKVAGSNPAPRRSSGPSMTCPIRSTTSSLRPLASGTSRRSRWRPLRRPTRSASPCCPRSGRSPRRGKLRPPDALLLMGGTRRAAHRSRLRDRLGGHGQDAHTDGRG